MVKKITDDQLKTISIDVHKKYFRDLSNQYSRIPGSFYWKDIRGIYVWGNQAFLSETTYQQSIIGKTDKELWPEESCSIIENDKKIITTGKTYGFEEAIVLNTEKKYFIILKSPLKNESGHIVGTCGNLIPLEKIENYLSFSTKNIKKIEQKSKISEQYMMSIIESVPGSIYWKNKEGVWIGCNQYTLQTTGLNFPENLIGKTDYELWPQHAEEIRENDLKVMNTGCTISKEESVLLPNGKIMYFAAEKMPLRDVEGNIIGVIGNSVDITELKETQAELIKAKEKAEAASHAKTAFIANMSHDIRTPLAGVIGLANILESQVTEPIQKKEAHDLGQSGNELLNMLNEILDVIAADHVNTNDIHEGPFCLSELVHGIVNLEQPSVTVKNIQLLTQLDPEIPPVLISDYKKIHHIILNLVGNAIKFTTSGHVKITVNLLQKQIETVMLQFQVIDTGKGIPEDAIAQVFDPFFRVTPSYKGLDKGHGLGLHIAQTYVQLLGGKIDVGSKINEGSMFSFTLPIKIGDQNALPPSASSEVISTQQPAVNPTVNLMPQNEVSNVLIIEDNPIALIVAETLLKSAHLTTTSAVDGESGLELAKTHSFPLILSDVGLPGISGIDLTRQLRAYETEHQITPALIIGLTAHADMSVRQECLDAGMNDVTIKPLTLHTVQAIMTQCSVLNTPSQSDNNDTNHQTPSTSPKLGLDLPDTETELFQLDRFSLLDPELAIKELGDNKALLVTMLKAFLEQLPQEKQAIQSAYKTQNWDQVEKLSHKMKGGTVYLKLNKLSMACQYLERYHKAGHSKLLEQLYQQMLQVMEATSSAVQTWLQ
ncbi:MAG: hybrid sensor histidine kinase/response regulator [Legionella sp.]|nr:MAG: hybrid sensor histidine kinase/response regulator [Legionella sp.]